jgi:hypothetical protein
MIKHFEIDGIIYEADYEIEPSNNGGSDEPSWEEHVRDLYVSVFSIIDEEDIEDIEECELPDLDAVRSEIEDMLNEPLKKGW